jgi:hypothetical protein
MTLENLASLCAILAFLSTSGLALFWLLVKSKCVTKQRFAERMAETDAWKIKMETTTNALTTEVALLKQDHNSQLSELNRTLKRIEESLSPFIADHQNLRERVLRIETKQQPPTQPCGV